MSFSDDGEEWYMCDTRSQCLEVPHRLTTTLNRYGCKHESPKSTQCLTGPTVRCRNDLQNFLGLLVVPPALYAKIYTKILQGSADPWFPGSEFMRLSKIKNHVFQSIVRSATAGTLTTRNCRESHENIFHCSSDMSNPGGRRHIVTVNHSWAKVQCWQFLDNEVEANYCLVYGGTCCGIILHHILDQGSQKLKLVILLRWRCEHSTSNRKRPRTVKNSSRMRLPA